MNLTLTLDGRADAAYIALVRSGYSVSRAPGPDGSTDLRVHDVVDTAASTRRVLHMVRRFDPKAELSASTSDAGIS